MDTKVQMVGSFFWWNADYNMPCSPQQQTDFQPYLSNLAVQPYGNMPLWKPLTKRTSNTSRLPSTCRKPWEMIWTTTPRPSSLPSESPLLWWSSLASSRTWRGIVCGPNPGWGPLASSLPSLVPSVLSVSSCTSRWNLQVSIWQCPSWWLVSVHAKDCFCLLFPTSELSFSYFPMQCHLDKWCVLSTSCVLCSSLRNYLTLRTSSAESQVYVDFLFSIKFITRKCLLYPTVSIHHSQEFTPCT